MHLIPGSLSTSFKSALAWLATILLVGAGVLAAQPSAARADAAPGARVSFNADWRFQKGDPASVGDALVYGRIKRWIIATGNDLLNPMAANPVRPVGNPGGEIPYAQTGFADGSWRKLNLPQIFPPYAPCAFAKMYISSR